MTGFGDAFKIWGCLFSFDLMDRQALLPRNYVSDIVISLVANVWIWICIQELKLEKVTKCKSNHLNLQVFLVCAQCHLLNNGYNEGSNSKS